MAESSATASTATHESTGAPESGSGGLPQFDTAWWPGEMAWMLIIFAVVYVLLAKVFVPKMGGTIAAREDTIAGDIGEARRLKSEAEAQAAVTARETAEARGRAQKLALDAKAKAQGEAAERQAVEEAKLNERLSKAEGEIRAARDQAMTHVRAIASDTAQLMVEKLTGSAATAQEIRAVADQG